MANHSSSADSFMQVRAIDFSGEAVSELQNGPVYQATSLTKASDIAVALKNGDIAVVSLPEEAIAPMSPFSPVQLANNILNNDNTDYNTIIVVVSNKFGVASNNRDSDQISEVLYKEYTETGNSGEAINNQLGNIITGTTSEIIESNSGAENTDDGFSLGAIGAAGGGILGVAAVAAVVVYLSRKSMKAKGKKEVKINFDYIPADLKKSVENLKHVASLHHKAGNTKVVSVLNSVFSHTQELFKRLKNKGSDGQYNMAAVNYTDSLDKLGYILGESNYLDVYKNPTLWDNPRERLRTIEHALQAVDTQLLTNIRQVNASQDINFQVSIEALNRSVNQADEVNDMLTTKDD